MTRGKREKPEEIEGKFSAIKVLGELSVSYIQVDNEYTIEGITRFYRTPYISLSLFLSAVYIAANKAHDRMHFLKILLIPQLHWLLLFRYARYERKILFAHFPPFSLSLSPSLLLSLSNDVTIENSNETGRCAIS